MTIKTAQLELKSRKFGIHFFKLISFVHKRSAKGSMRAAGIGPMRFLVAVCFECIPIAPTEMIMALSEIGAILAGPVRNLLLCRRRAGSLMLHIFGVRVYGYQQDSAETILEGLKVGLPGFPGNRLMNLFTPACHRHLPYRRKIYPHACQ